MTSLLLERTTGTGLDTGLDTDTEFGRIVDELTRRGFLGGALGSAALLGLAGCGSAASPTAPSASTPRSRTIDTAYGPVTVPGDPKRVVCVDTYTVSALLDVGYTPVGVGDGGADVVLPKYRASYEAIAKVASESQQVDVEAIAALTPDLILGVDYSYIADLRTKLTAIAPTAIFTWNSSGDWTAMAASAATAVGRAGPERTLEQRYHQRTAQLRTEYADVLGTARFDLVTAGGGQAYVWLPKSGVGGVLADAGVRFGAASAGTAVHAGRNDLAVGFKAVSYEDLGVLDDASALITVAGPDGKSDPDVAQMTTVSTFRRLPAARSGDVAAFVNFFPFSYGQALGALDELQALLDRLRKDHA